MFDALSPQPATLSMTKTCYNEFDACFAPLDTAVGQPDSVQWGSANADICHAGRRPRSREEPQHRARTERADSAALLPISSTSLYERIRPAIVRQHGHSNPCSCVSMHATSGPLHRHAARP